MDEQVKVSKRNIALALLVVYLVWGSTYLAIRIGLEAWPPALMGGARFTVAGMLLLMWGRFRNEPWPNAAVQIRTVAIAGILMFSVGNFSVVWAEQFVPSGMTAVIIATVSLWMIILEALRPGGERLSLAKMLGIAIGLGGVAVLMAPELNGAQNQNALLGQVGLLIGSLAWAAGSIYTRHAPIPRSNTISAGMQMVIGGLLLICLSGLIGEFESFAWHKVGSKPFWAMIYLTLFGSALAFTAYTFLLRHASPVLASTYAFANPVVAVVLGTIILDEPVTAYLLAGSILVIIALVVIQQARAREGKKSLANLIQPLSPSPLGAPARAVTQNCRAA
jgi:drug/metabolite transporter (DMT)-like permease